MTEINTDLTKKLDFHPTVLDLLSGGHIQQYASLDRLRTNEQWQFLSALSASQNKIIRLVTERVRLVG
jgi:hypothetical protein